MATRPTKRDQNHPRFPITASCSCMALLGLLDWVSCVYIVWFLIKAICSCPSFVVFWLVVNASALIEIRRRTGISGVSFLDVKGKNFKTALNSLKESYILHYLLFSARFHGHSKLQWVWLVQLWLDKVLSEPLDLHMHWSSRITHTWMEHIQQCYISAKDSSAGFHIMITFTKTVTDVVD